jgi:beta-glucanase (GH16 family)
MRRNTRIFSILALCYLTAAALPASAQQLPQPLRALPGYQLVFHDDFDSLDLSPDGKGDHTWYEGVWFSKKHAPLSNISASSSVLTLTWSRDQESPDTSITTLSHDTRHFRAWRYGYFEARAKWDVVKGAWPAFWLIPVQDAQRVNLYDGVRESGEIDIFEGQGDHPHILYTTVHDWTNSTHDSANRNNTVQLSPHIDLSHFHNYGLLWTPGKLKWYLDGEEIHAEPAGPIFDKQDYYIVLGSQEGVDWKAGDLSGVSASAISLHVDWVRVWQKK